MEKYSCRHFWLHTFVSIHVSNHVIVNVWVGYQRFSENTESLTTVTLINSILSQYSQSSLLGEVFFEWHKK